MLSIIQAAGWPIWPLIICSVFALALICERFVALKTSRIAPPQLLNEAITASSQSVPTPEIVTHLAQGSSMGSILATGLRTLNTNPRCTEAELRASMEITGRSVAHQLEKSLTALATIASAAPLLGLLGTVIGMIEIFGVHSASSVNSNPAQLAQGISIALYNTAFGLMVAIPALIFWRYFRNRVDSYLLTLELAGDQFVRHLMQLRK